MIRETAITALDGLVGFRQPIDTDYDDLDSGNIASSSGLYFQDATGLITIKNFIDSYDYPSPSVLQINTILDNLRYSAARDVLNYIFGDKSQNLESNILYPYEEDFVSTYDLTDDFYFIEIESYKNKRICLSLDYIWISLDSVATFNIYLYHSKKLSPIQTQPVTTVANESTKVSLGWQLDDTGTYRIGYKSADLGSAKPFKRDFELSNVQTYSQYACIEPYSADFLDSGRIDVNNQNALEDGYGINLEYSTFIDWTHEIIKNKDRFARAVQLQMALTAADRILTTTRSNTQQRYSGEALNKIAYILGNEERGTGLKGQFRLELKAIKEFFFPVMKIQTETLR